MSQEEKIIYDDAAIIDELKHVILTKYFDEINSLIYKNTLYFKHYDIPDQFLDDFWKNDQAEKYIRLLNDTVKQIFQETFPEDDYSHINAKLVIDDDKLVTKIRHLGKNKIQSLVCCDGQIISKTSHSEGSLETIVFICDSCDSAYTDNKPRKCIRCESTNILLHVTKENTTDFEIITLQELQTDMDRNDIMARTIEVYVKGDLVNKYKVGETVRITGIVKPEFYESLDRIKKKSSSSTISNIRFKYKIECHNIQSLKTNYQKILDNPSTYLTPEVVTKIQNIRAKYNDMELLQLLVDSFAQNVYGLNELKKAILIQNVGVPTINKQRNNINILIIGDPGLAKSRIIYDAADISLHYAIAVGKGASGVGLTASITKDDKNNPKLSIGAAVAADGGLCIFDEFSEIMEEYGSHLLECMERGTVTVNKYGINTTLNARASFLVATNPDSGKYSTVNTLLQNLSITPQLLSRFDIIFVVLDKRSKDFDNKLTSHILGQFDKTKLVITEEEKQKKKNLLDEETLKQYLFYAKTRKSENLTISNEAAKIYKDFYAELRQADHSSDNSATPRQFEACLRFGFGLTRLLLKDEVTEELALETDRLMVNAYESTGLLIKGNSTGLKGNMIYPKDLNDMSKEKAAIEIIRYVTNDGRDPRDSDFIITAFRKELKDITIYDAGKLFEKIKPSLRVQNNKFYLDE